MPVFEVAPIYLKKEKRVRKEGPLMNKKIIRIGTKRKPKPTKKERYLTGDIQTKVGLIQALIPLGLMEVSERMKEDVDELTGVYGSSLRLALFRLVSPPNRLRVNVSGNAK